MVSRETRRDFAGIEILYHSPFEKKTLFLRRNVEFRQCRAAFRSKEADTGKRIEFFRDEAVFPDAAGPAACFCPGEEEALPREGRKSISPFPSGRGRQTVSAFSIFIKNPNKRSRRGRCGAPP